MGLLLTLAMPLQALTVGDIAVQSQPGEPLRAEVPLRLSPQDLERGVRVELGNNVEYGTEGLSRPAVIDQLSVSLASSPRDVVRIESAAPVETSPLDIVLLVRSGLITIVRSYRIDLAAAAPAAQISRQKPEAPQPAVTPPAKPDSAAVAVPPPSPQPRVSQLPAWMRRLPAEYGPVRPGSTLTNIVQRLGVPRKMRWQTIVRLWEANKAQFMDENMHGIRVGTRLRIPADLPQALASLSRQEARRIVVEQWEIWQGVRQAPRKPQTVASAPPPTSTAAATPVPAPSAETEPEPERAVEPDDTSANRAVVAETVPAELPPQQATMVLPAQQELPVAADAEMGALLRGLEQLLAHRGQQANEARPAGFFVRSADLQAAIEGLEKRLTERLQNSLGHIALAPQARQRASGSTADSQALFEGWLPESPTTYVLLVENALLLLLAVLILVRWSRRRAY